MGQSTVSYSGLPSSIVFGGEGRLSRGCRPDTFLLYLNTGDHTVQDGDLTFSETGTGDTFTLSDCIPVPSKLLHPFSIDGVYYVVARVQDRRAKWWDQHAAMEYNRRRVDGDVDESTKADAKSLVEELLDMMGESSYDTSTVTASVYPYIKHCGPPVAALENVLHRLGYDLVLRANNTVKIIQVGSGSDKSDLSRFLDPPSGTDIDDPSSAEVVCGPTVWHSLFECEAVGVEDDEDTDLVDNLSYKPASGWSNEWPLFFAGVGESDRHLAFKSVWRWYRLKQLAGGGYSPPDASELGTAISQMLPLLDYKNAKTGSASNSTSQVARYGYPRVRGCWWPYTERRVNTAACQEFLDNFKLNHAAGIVEFEYPVFKVSLGCPIEAEIFLLAAHRFRMANGGYDKKVVSKSLGGSSATVRFVWPELFEVKTSIYSSCGSPASTSSNSASIESEANAILNLWNVAAKEPHPTRERTGIGIISQECDGIISSVYWEAGLSRDGRTVITAGCLEKASDRAADLYPLGWEDIT